MFWGCIRLKTHLYLYYWHSLCASHTLGTVPSISKYAEFQACSEQYLALYVLYYKVTDQHTDPTQPTQGTKTYIFNASIVSIAVTNGHIARKNKIAFARDLLFFSCSYFAISLKIHETSVVWISTTNSLGSRRTTVSCAQRTTMHVVRSLAKAIVCCSESTIRCRRSVCDWSIMH